MDSTGSCSTRSMNATVDRPEQLDDGASPGGRARTASANCCPALLAAVQDEVLLGGEVVVDRLLGDVGRARDVGDRHGVEAAARGTGAIAAAAIASRVWRFLRSRSGSGRRGHRDKCSRGGKITVGIARRCGGGDQTRPSRCASLRKSFDEVEAVRGVDFEVATGEVFGFLGPNGAGKSTTINMLCTLAKPTGGQRDGRRPRRRRASATTSAATSASSSRTRRSTAT